jgi:hypothetical protein
MGLGGGTWLLTHLNTPTFRLSSVHFFTTLRIHLDLAHLIIAHFSWCQCGHTIDDTPLNSLIDSIESPNVKTLEGERVRV